MCLPPFYHQPHLFNSFLWFFLFLLHLYHPVTIPMSDVIESFICLVFISCVSECDDIPVRKILCTDHLYSYERLLNMVMILQKNKITPPFLTKNIYF